MADKKISELTAFTPPLDTDIVPVVDLTAGSTKKITWTSIKAFLKTYFDSLYATTAQGTLATNALPKAGGDLSGAVNEKKGADIASASSIDLGAGTGNMIDITGTTTITALGTVQAGTRRVVRFTGALVLTYNATSLILPTSANITTVANDTAEFLSLGSGNWVCTHYTRRSGSPLVGGASNWG